MACLEAIAEISADEQGQALFPDQQQQQQPTVESQVETPPGLLASVRAAAASTVTAVCLPWTAYTRYMACVKAITELGELDDKGVPLFPGQQQEQGPAAAAAAQPLADTAVFTVAGFKAYLNGLQAIAALAGADDSADQQQQQEEEAASLAAAAKRVAPTASSMLSPVSAVRGMVASLQAIGQIGAIESETSLDLDRHHQQQQLWLQKLSAQDSKVSVPLATVPPAPSSTPVGHPASALSIFKLGSCLEAIAHLAEEDAKEQNQCTDHPTRSSSSSATSSSRSSVDLGRSRSSGSDGATCSKWALAAGPACGVVGASEAAADSPGVLGGFMRCMEAVARLGMS
jgi:hypothetical protein